MNSQALGSPLRILLIEDNPGDVFFIQEALRENGVRFEAQVAADGEEALAAVERCHLGEAPAPDLIALDLNLPKLDGKEVLRRIRERGWLDGTPIVILTSSSSPADRRETLELGAVRYLQKPSNLEDYLRMGAELRDLAKA